MVISLRQLLVIMLVIAILCLVRYLRRQIVEKTSARRRDANPPQEMVRCNHCRTFVPRAQARGDDQQGYFCADPRCLAGRARRDYF